ncbi:type III secretion system protein [Pseudomonas sp. NPDC088444]|uniref:type III secretion system protein n=1 Tax=Pseudomonas sp. NPDC088444 TaxID=3364456 RepID=UPI00384CF7AC
MNPVTLRTIDSTAAHFSRRLGMGASLTFNAQGLPGELTLRPQRLPDGDQTPFQTFNSALGVFSLSEAETLLSLLGELPVTLTGEHQPWYWQVLNQHFSPVIAELLSPLEPLSGNTALSTVDEAAGVSCRMALRLGHQTVHGVLRASADVLLRWLDGADWKVHRAQADEHWPVDTPLELGRLSLTLEQLASLQPGDVVLPTLSHFDSDGHGRLQLGGRQWAVQTDSHDRQLYVRFSHEEARKNDSGSAL